MEHYQSALALCDRSADDPMVGVDGRAAADTLERDLLLNCAAVMLDQRRPAAAALCCDAALAVDPCCAKAFYRRASASIHRVAALEALRALSPSPIVLTTWAGLQAASPAGPCLQPSQRKTAQWASQKRCGGLSRRRDCHFADIPSPSMLKTQLKGAVGTAE